VIVDGAVYRDGRRVAEPHDFGELRAACKTGGAVAWLGLYEPSKEEFASVAHEFDLHELAVEDARHGHQRPKIEEYGDSLFAVVQTVEYIDDELNVGEVNIFAGRNYVLSVRNRTREGFFRVRARAESEPHLLRHGSAFVLYALIDTVVDRYFPVLERLEDELEVVERYMFQGNPAREHIESLYALRQKLTTLKHAAGPLQEYIGKLHGGRVPEICTQTQDYFRDIDDHLSRINQSIDSLRDNVVTGTLVNLSLISLKESEIVKRLAAYAALVAVPTMIAGIYGMNFEHMPELKWTYGYPLSLATMVGIDAYLFYLFRKAGWL
jgi:magnesium transporter